MPRSPRRLRWTRRFQLALVLFLVLAWATPALISHSPLVGWGLRKATADLNGQASVGGVSLGWFSPVVLTDVEIIDSSGRKLLSAPRIATDRSLVQLLGDVSDLGTLAIERPAIHLTVDEETTNAEQVFKAWLDAPATRSDPLKVPGVAVMIVDASLKVEDLAGKRVWEAQGANVSLSLGKNWSSPLEVKTTASWTDPVGPGKLDVTLSLAKTPNPAGSPKLSGNVSALVQSMPMWVAEPFARRAEPEMKIDGRLHCQLTVGWGKSRAVETAPSEGAASPASEAPAFDLKGHVSLDRFTLAGPWLAGDRLDLERVEIPCQVSCTGDEIDIKSFEIKSDLCHVTLAGKFASTDDALTALRQASYDVNAEIDFARLAAAMPNLIRLRDDTQIVAGRVKLHLLSTPGSTGSHWQGSVGTTDLVATSRGQRIEWREPLALSLSAHQPPGKLLIVDKLRGSASFLELEASGSLDQFTAAAQCDLGRLESEMARFIDMGKLQMAGKGWARIGVRCAPDGTVEAVGEMQADQLKVSGLGPQAIVEPLVKVQWQLTGGATATGLGRIDAAGLRVEAGDDLCELELLAPIREAAEGPYGPMRLHVSGELARWLAWVQSATGAADNILLAGQSQIDIQAKYSDGKLDLESARIGLTNLRGKAAGLFVNERSLQLSATGGYQAGKLNLKNVVLACDSLGLEAAKLSAVEGKSGWTVVGEANVRADLTRVGAMLDDPAKPAAPWLGGRATGTVKFPAEAANASADVNLQIEQFVYGDPQNPTWVEPRVALVSRMEYDSKLDRLTLPSLKLTGYSIDADLQGHLAQASSSQDFELRGTLRYDMQTFSQQMEIYLGQGIVATGRGSDPIELRGSLRDFLTANPPAIRNQAAVPPKFGYAALSGLLAAGWQEGNVYGMKLGPAKLETQLKEGWLVMKPVEIDAHGGKLRLCPAMRLEPAPWEIVHAKSQVVDHVHVTPDVCAGMLKYVAPVLAGVTEAEGEFSVALDGARIPVFDMTQSSLGGQLSVHTIRVKGTALLFELVTALAETPSEAQIAPNTVIPFQMANGRVYHKDLVVTFPNVPNFSIRTSGSVGVDGTLQLVAEMPVPPKLVALAAKNGVPITNQTFKIPIGGTLTHPKIDAGALRQAEGDLLRDNLREAAGGAIQNQLNKGLDRLLRPK